MANTVYKKPYFDSGVFIGLIKDERIEKVGPKGEKTIIERGKIAEHLLGLAEQEVFLVVISALTLAEVHKKRGSPKLSQDEDEKILKYFERDFFMVVPIDRTIGEEANKFCRRYVSLPPNDAIHLACAKKAGCDVLWSWDSDLTQISDAGIRIENPYIWNPKPKPKQAEIPFEQNETDKEILTATTTPKDFPSPSPTASEPPDAQSPSVDPKKDD